MRNLASEISEIYDLLSRDVMRNSASYCFSNINAIYRSKIWKSSRGTWQKSKFFIWFMWDGII